MKRSSAWLFLFLSGFVFKTGIADPAPAVRSALNETGCITEPNHIQAYGLLGPVVEMQREESDFVWDPEAQAWKETDRYARDVMQANAQGVVTQNESRAIESGVLFWRAANQLDDHGRSSLYRTYDKDNWLTGNTEYIYNDQGCLSEVWIRSATDAVYEHWVYTQTDTQSVVEVFDGKGRLFSKDIRYKDRDESEFIQYIGDGRISFRYVTTGSGLQKQIIHYNDNNQALAREIHTEDKPGRLSLIESYQPGGQLNWRVRYEYEGEDPYGNWLKKTTYQLVLNGEGMEDFLLRRSEQNPDADPQDEMPMLAEYRSFRYTTGIPEFRLY